MEIKPHGNTKKSVPYFRTSDSARKMISDVASSHTPKRAIQCITQKAGGEINVGKPSDTPCNRQQISNMHRSATAKDKNVLYSVMLECKLAQGNTAEAFVRDVKAAPSPQCVLFFDWQVHDMVRFLTNNRKFGILTADTTYNLGEFYVTPTTYPHLILQDTRRKVHPILVHQQVDFASFNYFASTLIGLQKHLRHVLCFGTDGDKALVEAFSHNFPFAIQLRCFIHFKKNVQEKLRSLGIPHGVADEFISEIFGKQCGISHIKGLVDCSTAAEFDEMLLDLEQQWLDREKPYCPETGPRFYPYFCKYQADIVKCHMRCGLREAAGLGSPPAIFTTNSSESLNSCLKRKVDFKQHEWPEFNKLMKEFVLNQRDEVIRCLSGRGQYSLLPEYQHLAVPVSEWSKMTPEQRKKLVSEFDSVPLSFTTSKGIPTQHVQPFSISSGTLPSIEPLASGACSTLIDATASMTSAVSLSITPENSGIEVIPLVTLQGMWDKAEKLLGIAGGITPAPGSDAKAKMVLSLSSDIPHFVRYKESGQYYCDSACIRWKSANICGHTLAVAEVNNDLQQFLHWYSTKGNSPNITKLAMEGMPSGRGRKGGQSKRKRTRAAVEEVATVSLPITPKRKNMAKEGGEPSTTAVSCPVTPKEPTTVSCPITSYCSGTSISVSGNSNYVVDVTIPTTSTIPLTCPKTPPTTSFSVASPINVNPFYFKFIVGNIRMCQGCRTSLRTTEDLVPAPPFDLVIARVERRSFRDSSGNLVTPKRPSACHYHCHPRCILAVEPLYALSSINIPQDVLVLLTPIHKEHLRTFFNINVQ